MKGKICCLVAALAVALLVPMPAAAEESAPLVVQAPEQAPDQAQDQDACLDYTPAGDVLAQPALLLGPADMQPVAPGCRRCKDQPFCGCTYQGMPRISCDPCCYVNNIGVQICLS